MNAFVLLPYVNLPPGLQFFGQLALLDTLGNVVTSDGVRTF